MRTIGEDLAKDAVIDRFKLEEENEIQPSLCAYHSLKQVEARTHKDALKDKLDYVKAQRELYYRRNPPDDVKLTEAVISALVATDSEVMEASDELRKAQEVLYALDAALNVIDTRMSSLNNLTKLSVNDYYNSKEVDFTDMAVRPRSKHE